MRFHLCLSENPECPAASFVCVSIVLSERARMVVLDQTPFTGLLYAEQFGGSSKITNRPSDRRNLCVCLTCASIECNPDGTEDTNSCTICYKK